MWKAHKRGFNATENQDSDQSISEDEDLESGWTGGTISLSDTVESDKGGMLVLSQLDMLRDACESHPTNTLKISSDERNIDPFVEDEVENPLFNNGDATHHPIINSVNHADEEIVCVPATPSTPSSSDVIISENKISLFNPSREVVCGGWSEASREVKELVCFNEKSDCSSSHSVNLKTNKSSKVVDRARNSIKPKFSFNFHPFKDDDRYTTKCQENVTELPEKPMAPYQLSQKYDFVECSMAESLVHFHEKSGPILGGLEMDSEGDRISEEMVMKRYSSPANEALVDIYDLPMALDGAASSDDEVNQQHLNPIIPRTMADQFHDTFGAVSVTNEQAELALSRPMRCGLYEQLQQVIQSEKEKEIDRFTVSKAKTSHKDERPHTYVKILSRCLEAKLIVCSCILNDDGKDASVDNLHMKTKQNTYTSTIIFSSRICSDVDLEVGKVICIHPPWKEVCLPGKDESIILCSYYSEVQS